MVGGMEMNEQACIPTGPRETTIASFGRSTYRDIPLATFNKSIQIPLVIGHLLMCSLYMLDSEGVT